MSDEQDKPIENAGNITEIIEQEESIKNPLAKTGINETIKNFKVNTKDPFGHTIVEVLAVGNEYVIYEIDITDINNKLHVYIDGYTNESEAVIIKRYIKVKQKYIEAKGLLYRSTNFGMMKNRVAHTLQSSLSSDEIDGNREFEEPIKIIKMKSRILL